MTTVDSDRVLGLLAEKLLAEHFVRDDIFESGVSERIGRCRRQAWSWQVASFVGVFVLGVTLGAVGSARSATPPSEMTHEADRGRDGPRGGGPPACDDRPPPRD